MQADAALHTTLVVSVMLETNLAIILNLFLLFRILLGDEEVRGVGLGIGMSVNPASGRGDGIRNKGNGSWPFENV